MKVLLLKDVYKLGRAGDVKKVADGYGRNYLIPQGLALLATPGAMKQAEHIRSRAAEQRAILNEELGGVAEQLSKLALAFPAKAGETGKLYGSITPQMIADAIQEKSGYEVDRRQLDVQPLRTLGEHKVRVRLTLDLVPELSVVVYREGEAAEAVLEAPDETTTAAKAKAETKVEVEQEVETESETQAEVEEEPDTESDSTPETETSEV